MNLRRFNWLMRRPGFGVLVALLLLVAGFVSLSEFHRAHEHVLKQKLAQHCAGDHSHDRDSSSDNCAICFFLSASATSDFSIFCIPQPELREISELTFPPFSKPASVIVTLWAGRAPPASSLS